MPQFALKLNANGSVGQQDNGSAVAYADDEETDCCCGGPPVCYPLGFTHHSLRHYDGYLINPDDGTAKTPAEVLAGSLPGYSGRATTPVCHRVLVWAGRTVTSMVPDGADAPDYVLVTNDHGFRVFFAIRAPFETTQHSGIPLDYKPYWYSACELGGWSLGTDVHNITLSEVMALVTSGSAPDGVYDVIAKVKSQHAKFPAYLGGADITTPAGGGCVLQSISFQKGG